MSRWWNNTDVWIVALLAGGLFVPTYGPALAAEWEEFRQGLASEAEVVTPPLPDRETDTSPRVRIDAIPRAVRHERTFSCEPTYDYVPRAAGYHACH